MKVKVKSAEEILKTLTGCDIHPRFIRQDRCSFYFKMFQCCGKTFVATKDNDGDYALDCGWFVRPEWVEVARDENTPPDGYRIATPEERESNPHPYDVTVMWWNDFGWIESSESSYWKDENVPWAVPEDYSFVKEMTVADVSAALGYEVKIVRS